MTAIRLFTLCLAAAALVPGQSLRLILEPDVPDAAKVFAEGNGLIIPPGFTAVLPRSVPVVGLEIKFPTAGAAASSFHVHLDGRKLRGWQGRQGDLMILQIKATAATGLLEAEELELSLRKEEETLVKWPLRLVDQPFVDLFRSAESGAAPDVRIDKPRGRFLRGQPDEELQGAVVSPGEFRVSVAGTPVTRDPESDGWGFTTKLKLEPTARYVEIRVEGAGGAARHLYLPIIR